LHYRDFLASQAGIAANILADRLAKLEQAGLIEKTGDDPRSGKQVTSATAKGTDPLHPFDVPPSRSRATSLIAASTQSGGRLVE
jgi:DNA-binding HxlR family transcriptional regulator